MAAKNSKKVPAKTQPQSETKNDPPAIGALVREWAATQEPPIPVNTRGRVPADIVTQYLEATGQIITASGQLSPKTVRVDKALKTLGEEVTATTRVWAPEEEPAWVISGRERARARALERITRAEEIVAMALD